MAKLDPAKLNPIISPIDAIASSLASMAESSRAQALTMAEIHSFLARTLGKRGIPRVVSIRPATYSQPISPGEEEVPGFRRKGQETIRKPDSGTHQGE